MKSGYVFVIIFALLLTSCGGDKKRVPVWADGGNFGTSDESSDSKYESYIDYGGARSSNIISIPFTERDGVKYVKVTVNGVGLDMIFDTGCAGMHISVAEARYLYDKGTLTDDDFLGLSPAVTAEGNVSVDMVVNLREVSISDQVVVCHNVAATVSANTDAPLLLGNDVLDRVAEYSVDNVNHVINFKLK